MMQYEQEFTDSLTHIRGHVLCRMKDRGEDWEDVYSEAVYSLCKFLIEGRFNEGSTVKTLAISIALNKVKDYYRRLKVEQRAIRKHAQQTPLVAYDDYSETTLPHYLAVMVHRLPNKQRRVILFYLYESDNLADLARELGARQETVRSWFHRAKKKMHEELTEPKPDVIEEIEEKREALEVIPNGKREQLKWLIRMHNAYVCVCRMNNGRPGIEQMIEDSTDARNEIAQMLICGRQINKLLDDMSDADTITYLRAHRRTQ